MTPIPDLVRVSKLNTQFHSDPEYTQHIKYTSSSTTNQRKIRKEEKWKRERGIGRGSFGIVWLERCIQGDDNGKVRAVKEVKKLESGDYNRELEAIALFSHAKYEQCFVKSFGWYDGDDSIFITMEYLPNGDLHKYLKSPLPEKEGQEIVFQILEGLHFMHDNGFAHRDLKPANILIVCKGPKWWVKIADFGISKRATEGLTALRTSIGTPAFAAPEVLGHLRPGDESNDSYTNAVDIWSLGVIAFLILTSETLFNDPRRLGKYVAGSLIFPSAVLLANKVSAQGCDFVRSLMEPNPKDRPSVKECLQHPWLDHLIEAPETQREIKFSKSLPAPLDRSDPEASASWSTQDTISVNQTFEFVGTLAERAIPLSNKTPTLSMLEPVVQSSWNVLRTFLSAGVFAIAFSPDGKQIASAGIGTVRLWDSATGAARSTLKHSEWVVDVAFSPDGKQIASASHDDIVRLWDSATGAAHATLRGHSDIVWAVAFSPDGKQIVSASSDKTIRLWDSATGLARGTLRGHSGSVRAVAFSPDGKQIVSASSDKTVKLWDSATGVARGTLRGHSGSVRAVAFWPDGKQIVSASEDMTVRLWDLATEAACGTLKGHSNWISAVAFSPDGKHIASASWDMTVRLWHSATGAACNTLKHSGPVDDVAFSPDGKQIASASGDKTVLWDLTMAVASG